MEILESKMYGIVLEIAKNAKYIDPVLQRSIAKFVEIESTPIVVMEADPPPLGESDGS